MEATATPLASYRQLHSITLDDLGRSFGVHKTTVMRWEGGRIPAERVLDVERVTGIRRDLLRPDLYASEVAPVDPAKVPAASPAAVSQSDAEPSSCPTQKRPRAARNPTQATP